MASLTPDIAKKKSPIVSPLEKVGMEEIEVALNLPVENKQVMQMGTASAYVNLIKPEAKGIHMSRLFIRLTEELAEKELSPKLIKNILYGFLESHSGLSDSAFLSLSYEHPYKQKSLTSNQKSWRAYPVEYKASLNTKEEFSFDLTFSVFYSSTCPCSAALSRQAIQERFTESFSKRTENVSFEEMRNWLGEEKNIAATPHSQRSKATITLKLTEDFSPSLPRLIDLAEDTLKTSVQSIVKREDEKEFAKLNAANLMFAEDAARKLKKAVHQLSDVKSFDIKVCHYESLHAHNAVAYAKG